MTRWQCSSSVSVSCSFASSAAARAAPCSPPARGVDGPWRCSPALSARASCKAACSSARSPLRAARRVRFSGAREQLRGRGVSD